MRAWDRAARTIIRRQHIEGWVKVLRSPGFVIPEGRTRAQHLWIEGRRAAASGCRLVVTDSQR